MTTRRQFLAANAALFGTTLVSAGVPSLPARDRLSILFLGGTGFIGSHVTQTIRKGIVSTDILADPHVALIGALSALLAAALNHPNVVQIFDLGRIEEHYFIAMECIDGKDVRNILRNLVSKGCAVTVVPATTSAEEVLAMRPDGVFLSNGPGDPEPITYAQENIRKLLGKVPLFGICLGHQLLSIALGGNTYKLKFGHRGGNQPVRQGAGHNVEITSQNHGFAVAADTLRDDSLITHINLNDNTVEGLQHKTAPAFSVQYHPEASPGPHDANYLFGEFIKMMDKFKAKG